MFNNIEFILFWSDALVGVLLFMALCFAIVVLRHEHLRAPWRQVFNRPVNLVATIVLLVFVSIGLLDSIHFRYKGEAAVNEKSFDAVSVLDVILEPLVEHQERSYSSPFATHLFVKEAIEQEDGSVVRDYPRLEYGGAHLQENQSVASDVFSRLFSVVSLSLLIWMVTVGGLLWVSALKSKQSVSEKIIAINTGKVEFPWRTLMLTLGFGILLIVFIADLMPLYHILGTSKIGEDVLYQSLKSIRTGLLIGTITTLFMLPFAITLGIMAGYFRGWVDDVIQYCYTTLSSIPGVLLIAAAVLTLQVVISRHQEWFQTMAERSDARLLALCLILGITSWTGLCRLLRGETLKLREIEFIQAARALGVGHFKIIMRHLLPNVGHIILIAVALDFSGLVLAEAVLSYVGVGVDPSTYSWGTMINSARLEMARVPIVWWSLTAAFVFMFAMVLAANIFADALRDAFDPRTSQ